MDKLSLPRFKVHQSVKDESYLNNVDAKRERINWAHSITGIPDVWWSTKGQGVRVAILDTGIDTDHKDFRGAIAEKRDFSGDGIEDENGHGTHVAGIIGARQNNYGFVGVAPKCDLLIGKVLGDDGSGAYSWISAGIRWAVAEGAHIINMSLGGPVSDPDLYDAIHEALLAGVIICCAGGNDGAINSNNIGYPGRYGGVLTIASHDWNGQASGFSSTGGEIDFMAPGDKIWSTYRKGGFAELSGTSMATPFVSGLCALILSKHMDQEENGSPVHNTSDMKEHLMFMATHPGWHDNVRGYGALQPFSYFYGR